MSIILLTSLQAEIFVRTFNRLRMNSAEVYSKRERVFYYAKRIVGA